MLKKPLNKFVITLLALYLLVLGVSCRQDSGLAELDQYLTAADQANSTATAQELPPVDSGGDFQGLNYVEGGVAVANDKSKGHCGDGIINGAEQCDKDAIRTLSCSELGGLGGIVGCSADCKLDISRCITPEVDQLLGGAVENCKIKCDTNKCTGGCQPSAMVANQSECRFECGDDCVGTCEGKFENHLTNCRFACLCTTGTSGAPMCECNLPECDTLVSVAPNIAAQISKFIPNGNYP